MPNQRPYGQIYDQYANTPVQSQIDSPTTLEFLMPAGINRRTVVGSDNNLYKIGDEGVNPRGAKNVVWSSEGYTFNGVTVPALTSGQKFATGTQNVNISTATVPTGFTLPTVLDVSPYRNLALVVSLSSLTGTSIQFELDLLDDSGTPVSIAVWKPAAITSAPSSFLVSMGPGVGFPPGTLPTGYDAANVPANWTYSVIPLAFLPNAKFAWTATALTAASWKAWLYGIN